MDWRVKRMVRSERSSSLMASVSMRVGLRWKEVSVDLRRSV